MGLVLRRDGVSDPFHGRGFDPRAAAQCRARSRVTVHEAGHQFWYGLVANDEAEEAWLDEGFTSYMTAKALDARLGPEAWGRRFFAGDDGRGRVTGWFFVASGVSVPRGSDDRATLRSRGSERLHGEERLDLS